MKFFTAKRSLVDIRRNRRSRASGSESIQARSLARLLSSGAYSIGDGQGEAPFALLSPFPAPAPEGGGALRARALRILRNIGLGLLILQCAYILATCILIVSYKSMDPPSTLLMAYRKWGYGWKLERPRPQRLRRIPLFMRSMLISVEDGKFFKHFGLDFEAFQRAREINARVGKPLYGGSTLTMQLARTLFLVPEKSYLRKYLEAITALELELFLGKDRILELYFGYAEWGRGIFGIEAAARKYYGVGVQALSRDEAARLIALLSSPIRFKPATLERSAILRERYHYLSRRFDGGERRADVAGDVAITVPDAQPAVVRDLPSPPYPTEDGTAPPPSPEPESAPTSAEPPADGDDGAPAANGG